MIITFKNTSSVIALVACGAILLTRPSFGSDDSKTLDPKKALNALFGGGGPKIRAQGHPIQNETTSPEPKPKVNTLSKPAPSTPASSSWVDVMPTLNAGGDFANLVFDGKNGTRTYDFFTVDTKNKAHMQTVDTYIKGLVQFGSQTTEDELKNFINKLTAPAITERREHCLLTSAIVIEAFYKAKPGLGIRFSYDKLTARKDLKTKLGINDDVPLFGFKNESTEETITMLVDHLLKNLPNPATGSGSTQSNRTVPEISGATLNPVKPVETSNSNKPTPTKPLLTEIALAVTAPNLHSPALRPIAEIQLPHLKPPTDKNSPAYKFYTLLTANNNRLLKQLSTLSKNTLYSSDNLNKNKTKFVSTLTNSTLTKKPDYNFFTNIKLDEINLIFSGDLENNSIAILLRNFAISNLQSPIS
jgi:hypothetical protein